MNPLKTLSKLFYITITADGFVHPKELEIGNLMINVEQLDEILFNAELSDLKNRNRAEVMLECIDELKEFNTEDQVRFMAWMTAVANSDGLMDDNEWTLIYNIYHKALSLSYQELMIKQREIYHIKREYFISGNLGNMIQI